MAKLNVAVAGFRNNGRGHAQRAAAYSKTRLVSVSDLLPERRAQARELFGDVELYDDYRRQIADGDADVVVVSLPVPLHATAVTAALKAGKHVLCEKPPGCDAREARKMVDLAKDKGRVLSWGLQRRYLPEMFAARHAIRRGMLGNIYRVDVRYTLSRLSFLKDDRFRMLKKGGGVFFDLGVHALDMAWSLLGCPKATRVVAANHLVFPDWNGVDRVEDMAEDNAMALIFLEAGESGVAPVISVETSYLSQRPKGVATEHRPHLQILGDKGGLQTPSLVFAGGGYDKVETRELPIAKSWRRGDTAGMWADFVRACEGKGDLMITAEHGVELMKIIDAVIKSAEQGKEIRLK